ncbi:cupin domain-containing protein [Candidatus Gottesmanbacteria bacterium]|nr:cupin domain-containing protein [Candidatus Gottesmanbacteria bacterium]
MRGYIGNIEKLTNANINFRTVLYTSKYLQLVLMTIPGGTEIGEEIHAENDQFFRVEAGNGAVIIDGVSHEVSDGTAIIVPKGAKHNVVNTSITEPLKLYTLYSPPHHLDAVVHRTKAEAESSDEEFDGVTTE